MTKAKEQVVKEAEEIVKEAPRTTYGFMYSFMGYDRVKEEPIYACQILRPVNDTTLLRNASGTLHTPVVVYRPTLEEAKARAIEVEQEFIKNAKKIVEMEEEEISVEDFVNIK